MNKVSKARQKKEQIVAQLAEKVGKSKGLVFSNYQGLTHVQLEKLKKAVKSLQAEFVVTKNTLLKLALLNSKFEAPNPKQRDSGVVPLSGTPQNPFRISDFQGPTATLFLYGDPIEPLKQLAKTIKELNLPTIKLGIIEGQSLDSQQVLKLATLPSRDILVTQLLFQMKAPIYRLHHALNWNMRKLVLTLKAIETKKNF